MKFGLIGEKLGHSYSKFIHETLGAYEYDLYPIAPSQLDSFIKSRNFRGLNVTIPYKEAVMPLCDVVDPLAAEIGAVNTLYFDKSNILHGANTDYYGFLYAIDAAGLTIKNKKTLILGDGGTSKTVYTALSNSGASDILVASRHSTSKGAPNAKHIVSYESLAFHTDIELIVNTTPVGMFPSIDRSPCNLEIFPRCTGVFDVIYNPTPTLLVSQAHALEIPAANGLSMLVAQATKAAELFTDSPLRFQNQNERITELLLQKL